MTRGEQIKSDIIDELRWDPKVGSSDVDAAIEKGLIEDAAWSAPAVMEVFNHLRVGSPRPGIQHALMIVGVS